MMELIFSLALMVKKFPEKKYNSIGNAEEELMLVFINSEEVSI